MRDILEVKQIEKKIKKDEIKNQDNEVNNDKISKNSQKNKKNRIISGLSIAVSVLALSTLGLGIGLGLSQSYSMSYQNKLESVYKSNFFSMLDSVNNLDTKLSKITASNSSTFQRKTLLEASKNANEAEISVSFLPLSQQDIEDTIHLVNQISGYTATLSEKIASGGVISSEEMNSLNKILQVVRVLKIKLNDFARKLDEGLSILDYSMNIDSNGNLFSKSLALNIKNDVEYPTMIYDGPFSDSVVNSPIKGLKGEKVSKSVALKKIQSTMKNITDINFDCETKGKFETYNYIATNSDNEKLFIQSTCIGGNILTINGNGKNGKEEIDFNEAKNLALKFVADNGIKEAEVVWFDSIDNDIYFNIAPVKKDIILYPDLIKVKVNLTTGTIIGYDATSYYTNHTERNLAKGRETFNSAERKVQKDFKILGSRYVLTPLDYNREVVCIEVEAEKNNGTYYFYYNCLTGELENILKVIETDNGNLLM